MNIAEFQGRGIKVMVTGRASANAALATFEYRANVVDVSQFTDPFDIVKAALNDAREHAKQKGMEWIDCMQATLFTGIAKPPPSEYTGS